MLYDFQKRSNQRKKNSQRGSSFFHKHNNLQQITKLNHKQNLLAYKRRPKDKRRPRMFTIKPIRPHNNLRKA